MFLTEKDKQQIYHLKAKGITLKRMSEVLNCNYTLFISAVNGKRELPDKYMPALIKILGDEKI